jgi:hypothetical protein
MLVKHRILTMSAAHRNAFSPCASLPPEILVQAFGYLSPEECATAASISPMWRSTAHIFIPSSGQPSLPLLLRHRSIVFSSRDPALSS